MNSITLATLVQARRDALLREAEHERMLKKLSTPAVATAKRTAPRLSHVAGRNLQWQQLLR